MITRKDINEPDDRFHQVIIEYATKVQREKIQAVIYPNYCDRVRLKLNPCSLGFEIHKDDLRNLIEVLNASLLAIE